MMICRLRRNACIEERCQKGKEDLSQASFKYTHFAVAGKSSYEDERRSLRHHHMMISDAEGLRNVISSKKCPVYLHLPWLGNVSMRYEMQIKTAVKCCYFAVEPCIVYTTRQLLPAAKKDVLPAFHQSNIVYQFLCHCDSLYVGCISQRLQHRIKQHMPKTIFQEHISQDRSTLARSCKPIRSFKAETSFSAIGQHLLQNSTCACEYNDNKFSIFAHGCKSFHLFTLEAMFIKTSKPNLCKQK